MKKKFYEIKVSDEEFKKIKSNKRSISIQLGTDEMKKISSGEKVIFIRERDNKRLKKKVKRTYSYPTFEDLAKNVKKAKLGLKKKEELNCDKLRETFSKEDEKKYGVLGIEVKPKVTFMRIILVILCIVLAAILWSRMDKFMTKLNTEKINRQINELSKERVSYVFVEINPAMVFTLKDDRVEGVACLNADCMKMYDEIKLDGLTLKESIESVYSLAKDKGFDTSKGVTVKSSRNVAIEGLEYVSIEYVSDEDEEKLLANVKNNEDIIVENDDEGYYAKLWNELKKDSRYDKIYACAMNGQKLECHFKPEMISPMEGILSGSNPVTKAMQLWLMTHLDDIGATLDKFNIENNFAEPASGPDDVKSNTLFINGIGFDYVLDYTHQNVNIKNACYSRNEKKGECYPEYGMCECTRSYMAFALKDLDLLNPSTILGNLKVNETENGTCIQ